MAYETIIRGGGQLFTNRQPAWGALRGDPIYREMFLLIKRGVLSNFAAHADPACVRGRV
jgi:hypothetical protein